MKDTNTGTIKITGKLKIKWESGKYDTEYGKITIFSNKDIEKNKKPPISRTAF